jgi:hypothetical protein
LAPQVPRLSGQRSSTAPLPWIVVATAIPARSASARRAAWAPDQWTPEPAITAGRRAASMAAAARRSSASGGTGRAAGTAAGVSSIAGERRWSSTSSGTMRATGAGRPPVARATASATSPGSSAASSATPCQAVTAR